MEMDTTTIIILVGVGVLLAVQQMRYRRVSLRTLALPIAVAVVLWYAYVQGAPTIGNDMGLYLICGAIGAVLGLVGGVLSSMHRDEATGVWLVKGGAVYAGLLLALIAGRLGFAYYAENGGYAAVRQFSIDHAISGQAPIVAALMLMVVTTILARLVVVLARLGYSSTRPGTLGTSFARS
jgi:hypothetical protein